MEKLKKKNSSLEGLQTLTPTISSPPDSYNASFPYLCLFLSIPIPSSCLSSFGDGLSNCLPVCWQTLSTPMANVIINVSDSLPLSLFPLLYPYCHSPSFCQTSLCFNFNLKFSLRFSCWQTFHAIISHSLLLTPTPHCQPLGNQFP